LACLVFDMWAIWVFSLVVISLSKKPHPLMRVWIQFPESLKNICV
jgi:hypothetical protein